MPAPRPTDDRALLEHAAWVRALAHRLVADHALADDLAQETCVAALEHPPLALERGAVHARGWLRAVLGNFARQAGRAGTRRHAREVRAARPEAEAGPLEVLARAAAHRELVDAVMALPEPFRTAILLRFFDELPPRRIARELGVPVATVHSRIQRGLAQLRDRLDERSRGDRSAWVSALLPLARELGPSFPLSIGALTMKWKLVAVAALVLCGGFGVWRLRQVESAPALVPATMVAAEAPRGERASELSIAQRAAEPELEPRAPVLPAETPAPAQAAVAPARLLEGRVLDADAEPQRGIEVAFRPKNANDAAPGERERARSSGDGRFSMPMPERGGELLAADDAYATVMAGCFEPGSSIEPVVVVAPQRALAGHVVDEEGRALNGARVDLELAADFGMRFAHVLDATRAVRVRAESDASGAFELERAPIVSGSRLVTALAGYRSDARAAPDFADRSLEIVLVREPVAGHALRGIVLAPDGNAVANAHVALGELHVTSADNGEFAFDLSNDEAHAVRLVAAKRGFLPAEASATADSPGSAPRWPDYVRLRLGGEPARLAGRIVDEKGEPVAHARVWLADPTLFGLIDGSPTQVEHVLAGAPSAEELERRGAAPTEGHDIPDLLWNFVEADAHGEFELGGLLPRDYSLRVMDPVTLVHAELGPFAAGSTGLTLVLREDDVFTRVAGRVVSGAGRPVAGVRVGCSRTVARVQFQLAHGQQTSSRGYPGPSTVTDADGRFELARIPREGVRLTFGGDAIQPIDRELDQHEDVDELSITVALRCHVQIELRERPQRADSFRVLDEDGQELAISRFRGEDEYASTSFPLVDGRSEVFALPEGVRTIVLYLGEQEVERHEAALGTGELNWLRF